MADAKPPLRPEIRVELRDISPLAAAEARAKEIMDHVGADGFAEAPDKFNIPPGKIPDGWTYEWKMRTVLEKEYPAYQVSLANTGWTPVPMDRHPELMPKGYKGKTVEMDGLILMERPKSITEMVSKRDLRRARDQVRFKEEQLGAAPPGQFERANKDNSLVKVRKSYEPMAIPSE
jgi:hypothetical protein